MRYRTTLAAMAVLTFPVFAQNRQETNAKQGSQETEFKGKLIDADCYTEPKCRVGSNTQRFGLMLADGTFLKFDEGGNSKVADTLKKSSKGRHLLDAKPGKAKRITVKVKGTRTSDTFNLESVSL